MKGSVPELVFLFRTVSACMQVSSAPLIINGFYVQRYTSRLIGDLSTQLRVSVTRGQLKSVTIEG